ncbi:MAG: DUF1328 domain-containing protein [Burkholderiales bacterium]|nr:DUF1328 domain-containing protein [Burkholderiales bacterium]
MLSRAVTFLVIAIIAAVFGFGEIVGSIAGVALVLCFVFLALVLITLVTGTKPGG